MALQVVFFLSVIISLFFFLIKFFISAVHNIDCKFHIDRRTILLILY